MKLKVFTIVFVFSISCLSFFMFDSVQSSEDDYHNQVEEFFKLVKNSNYGEAIDNLYEKSPWKESIGDDINKLKSQFIGLPPLVGEYYSAELIGEEQVVGRLVHLHYFVSYDRQPLSFYFTFYKPQDKWIIYGFSYEDNIDDELKEKNRLNFIYDEK